ncbi:hypothetical protein AS189_09710 [Arthrobacter alpinus]|uniref:DUF4913 domain-containing protein n=1 Tax=Arthrobacter alpinus TaxID=656366 RepID=A0A0S2LYY8_9MICC|nr:hypothetical protein [Arthrobacter alpinus]ALO66725.1 hypothetical protein AS189_09710 [Arthrobacter alpinus]
MNPFDDDEAADRLFGDLSTGEILQRPPDGLEAPTYRWRELDRVSAPKAWTALSGWVSWFVATYRLTSSVVPDCWWRHSELVAELYALQKAELSSYTPTDPGFGPLGFHERLPLAIERLRIETRTIGCVGLQVHREVSPRLLPTGGPEFLAWTAESHQIVSENSGDASHVVGGSSHHG